MIVPQRTQSINLSLVSLHPSVCDCPAINLFPNPLALHPAKPSRVLRQSSELNCSETVTCSAVLPIFYESGSSPDPCPAPADNRTTPTPSPLPASHPPTGRDVNPAVLCATASFLAHLRLSCLVTRPSFRPIFSIPLLQKCPSLAVVLFFLDDSKPHLIPSCLQRQTNPYRQPSYPALSQLDRPPRQTAPEHCTRGSTRSDATAQPFHDHSCPPIYVRHRLQTGQLRPNLTRNSLRAHIDALWRRATRRIRVGSGL